MYAIVECGNKQYKVEQGDVLKVDKINTKDKKIDLDVVCFHDGEKMIYKTNKKVKAEIINPCIKGKKIIVFKYKAKKNIRKKAGHRQLYTLLSIVSLQ